jgi:hypothetical protein
MKPSRVAIRSYQVGFGDCFLLSFAYQEEERHVLIDFGSTGLPDNVPSSRMKDIAKNIKARVGDEPFAIVATHRHRDHISGFATNASGTAPGDIIKSMKPRLVTQPWTEDPKLATDAKGPLEAVPGVRRAAAYRVQSLNAMHDVADQLLREMKRNRSLHGSSLRAQLGFLGENNLKNLSAVKNLMNMGSAEYLFAGKKTKLSQHLPGVNVEVLGPPTVQQYDGVKNQRDEDEDEFWHLTAAAGRLIEPVSQTRMKPLFAARYVVARNNYRFPPDTRWLIKRARSLRTDQMLRIVRALDKAMNNTSVILLFRAGGKSLLFPGDAQIENWEFALSQPAVVKKLRQVDLYKVGHHGSLNATPKSLWAHLDKRSEDKNDPKRLTSMMSTMLGQHGSEENNSEVPRGKLTSTLRRFSTHFTTQTLRPSQLFHEVVIDL